MIGNGWWGFGIENGTPLTVSLRFPYELGRTLKNDNSSLSKFACDYIE